MWTLETIIDDVHYRIKCRGLSTADGIELESTWATLNAQFSDTDDNYALYLLAQRRLFEFCRLATVAFEQSEDGEQWQANAIDNFKEFLTLPEELTAQWQGAVLLKNPHRGQESALDDLKNLVASMKGLLAQS